jgi:hypothetical protein
MTSAPTHCGKIKHITVFGRTSVELPLLFVFPMVEIRHQYVEQNGPSRWVRINRYEIFDSDPLIITESLRWYCYYHLVSLMFENSLSNVASSSLLDCKFVAPNRFLSVLGFDEMNGYKWSHPLCHPIGSILRYHQ